MRTLLLATIIGAFAAGFGHAQLNLSAPGENGIEIYSSVQAVPFAESVDTGKWYAYTVTGIVAQSDADGVANAFSYDGYMWDTKQKSNNGHGNNADGVDSSNPGKSKIGLDTNTAVDDEIKSNVVVLNADGTYTVTDPSGGNLVFGSWDISANINGVPLGSFAYNSPALDVQSETKSLVFDPPLVFNVQEVVLNWDGDGNAGDLDGNFSIMGDAVREPPAPTGELNIPQTYYVEGQIPTVSYKIERE